MYKTGLQIILQTFTKQFLQYFSRVNYEILKYFESNFLI